MKIVLDTNCLLVSIQEYSDFYWLWKAFHDRKFILCYTTEILNEYHEVLLHYYSKSIADGVVEDILISKNSEPVTVYYHWNLITSDYDDNKFVDCAVSANASYIVTNDRHFNILRDIDFPKINIVTINEFQEKI